MLLSLFIIVVFVAINALVVLVVDIFGHENFSHALCNSLPLYVRAVVVIVSFCWGQTI